MTNHGFELPKKADKTMVITCGTVQEVYYNKNVDNYWTILIPQLETTVCRAHFLLPCTHFLTVVAWARPQTLSGFRIICLSFEA